MLTIAVQQQYNLSSPAVMTSIVTPTYITFYSYEYLQLSLNPSNHYSQVRFCFPSIHQLDSELVLLYLNKSN